jgi:hypothetical protein
MLVTTGSGNTEQRSASKNAPCSVLLHFPLSWSTRVPKYRRRAARPKACVATGKYLYDWSVSEEYQSLKSPSQLLTTGEGQNRIQAALGNKLRGSVTAIAKPDLDKLVCRLLTQGVLTPGSIALMAPHHRAAHLSISPRSRDSDEMHSFRTKSYGLLSWKTSANHLGIDSA